MTKKEELILISILKEQHFRAIPKHNLYSCHTSDLLHVSGRKTDIESRCGFEDCHNLDMT